MLLTLKRHALLTTLLAVLALLGMGFSHLALTDIAHGEPNLSAEWGIVQLSFLVFFLLALSSLTLANQVRKQLVLIT